MVDTAGSPRAITQFLRKLGAAGDVERSSEFRVLRTVDAVQRQRRQVTQLVEHSQRLLRHSAETRNEFWKQTTPESHHSWSGKTYACKDHLWREVLGRLPDPSLPINPRTRIIECRQLGFYGLCYGGTTAVRVPPLLDGYAVSICLAAFNDWARKVVTLDFRAAYIFTAAWIGRNLRAAHRVSKTTDNIDRLFLKPNFMKPRLLFNFVAIVSGVASSTLPATALAQTHLSEWERGVAVESKEQPDMRVYLWFYEWHMFGAMKPGQHTNGTWKNRVTVRGDRLAAAIQSENPGLSLNMRAVADGADLMLHVTNETDREWPRLASIIACFNPGPQADRNRRFANTNSWFLSADGLKPLAIKAPREIHYNHALRKAINAQADDGKFVWSPKWPTSEVDAIDGLIIRESTDGTWVTGIAWNRFLSAQGHNPWECMHLSAHVGPLAPRQTRTVTGRIWLFRGNKNDLLSRYRQWKTQQVN